MNTTPIPPSPEAVATPLAAPLVTPPAIPNPTLPISVVEPIPRDAAPKAALPRTLATTDPVLNGTGAPPPPLKRSWLAVFPKPEFRLARRCAHPVQVPPIHRTG